MNQNTDRIRAMNAVRLPASITPRQHEFCLQFIQTGNMALSARKAGYRTHNASASGCRLLEREDIRDFIHALRAAAARASQVGTVETLASDMGRAKNEVIASLADLFTVTDGFLRLREPDSLSPTALSLVKGFEFHDNDSIAGYRLDPCQVGPAFTRLMTLSGRS